MGAKWSTAGFGSIVVIVSIAMQVLVAIGFVAAQLASDSTFRPGGLAELFSDNLGLMVAIATLVSSLVGTILVFIFIKLRRNVAFLGYLGAGAIARNTTLVLLAISAVLLVLSEFLRVILKQPQPEFMVEVYTTSVWPALLWISFIIVAPVFEEIFFRGFLFVGFLQSRVGPALAIGVTALVWTLLHAQYGAYEMANIFIFGIVLGVARLKTGSLWSPLIMHVFWNLVATTSVALSTV